MAISQITANSIADGTVVASDIADGTITNAKIAAVANTKITGVLTASQLANTAVTAGVYGGSSNSALITVDAQGRITSASNVSTSNSEFTSVGVGTAPSGTSGEIRATNNITAYYSDERLKNKLGNIENALVKLESLNGFYYEANETAQSLGYDVIREVGVSAQEVQHVLPEVVVPAPIDEKYLTVRYERLVPLLIEAIKELSEKVKALEVK